MAIKESWVLPRNWYWRDDERWRFCSSMSLTVTTSSAGREIANATPCRLATRHKDYFRLEDNSTKSTWMQAAFSERKDFETQISTLTTELSECNGRRGRLTTVNNKIPDRETRLASALKAKECECT